MEVFLNNITWYNYVCISMTLLNIILIMYWMIFISKNLIDTANYDTLADTNTYMFVTSTVEIFHLFCIYIWIIEGSADMLGGSLALSELSYAVWENYVPFVIFLLVSRKIYKSKHIKKQNTRGKSR